MATDDDADIPETGAIFTFGKSRFADNLPSKFWIRNDKAMHISCGDEHSAIITESGRLYTFGSNDWGQLGLGHMKPTTKPGCVKSLKQEGVNLVACGRSHTIVCTKAGRLYSFGAGSDGQLGTGDAQCATSPQLINLPEQKYKLLSAGTDHSAALTTDGTLYMWGSGSEGQLGLGNTDSVETPKELKFHSSVSWVSCGYYHTAIVTDDGKLYTFGEKEFGKLGLTEDQLEDTTTPKHVESITEKIKLVACGGAHTAVISDVGNLYTFGDGMHGQLGNGPSLLQLSLPQKVARLSEHKCKYVSCGDNHTAVITEKGAMYTFGDGRHGKLGISEEDFCNIFKPCKVSRFTSFDVQSVACGGCHMLTVAVKRDQANGELSSSADSEEEDPLRKSSKDPLRKSSNRISEVMAQNESILGQTYNVDVEGTNEKDKLSNTYGGTARDRRRQKEQTDNPPPLARTLPPISITTANNTRSEPKPAPRPLPRAHTNRLDAQKMPAINPQKTTVEKKNSESEEESDKQDEKVRVSLHKRHHSKSGYWRDLKPMEDKQEKKEQDVAVKETEITSQKVKQLQQELELKHNWARAALRETLGKELQESSSSSSSEDADDEDSSESGTEEMDQSPVIKVTHQIIDDSTPNEIKKKASEDESEDEDEDDESGVSDLEDLDPKEKKKREKEKEKEKEKKEREKQKQLEKERKEKEKAEKERLKQEKEEEKKRKKEEELRKKEEEKKRKEEEKKKREEEKKKIAAAKKAKTKTKKKEFEDEEESDDEDEEEEDDESDEESEEEKPKKMMNQKKGKEEAKKAKAKEETKKKEAAKKKKRVQESESEDDESEEEVPKPKSKDKKTTDIFGRSKAAPKKIEESEDDDDDDESEDEEEVLNKKKDKEKSTQQESPSKWKFWQKQNQTESEKKKQEEAAAAKQAQSQEKSKTCVIL